MQKSPPIWGELWMKRIFRRSTSGGVGSNSASITPKNVEYDSRHSGNKLQILQTVERPILITIVHDLLGVVFSDAPNAGEFFFSCGIQIKTLRHKISPRVESSCVEGQSPGQVSSPLIPPPDYSSRRWV